MKFLLMILIPIYLFSQVKIYPDTIVSVKKERFPCTITSIDQSVINLKYGKDKTGYIFLHGIEKISFDSLGIIFTRNSGFITDIYLLQDILKSRAKTSTPTSNSLLTPKSIWKLTLSNHDVFSRIILKNLDKDSLVFSRVKKTNRISVDSIDTMRKIGKSNFWEGAVIGSALGVAVGVMLSGSTSSETPKRAKGGGNEFGNLSLRLNPVDEGIAGAVGGALGGFLIGGVIGSMYSSDLVYDLHNKSKAEKLKLIKYILIKQH